MGDEGEYLYARDGKGNVIRLFHNPYSHAEGKQVTATGQYSHAEGYSARPFDCYSQQAEALAQTLSKVAAQTGVSMSELADALQKVANTGMQNVVQSLQNLEKTLYNTPVGFSPKPVVIDSKEENPQKDFRSELKTLNSKNEYDIIDVYSDVEFDF
jgi:transcriptional regulator with XRE-family HTH domain